MTDIIELAKKCGFQAPWLFEERLQAFEVAIRQDQIEKDKGICDRFAERKMSSSECASAIAAQITKQVQGYV